MNESTELQGLGGWLVLVGIGIVAAPIRLLYIVLTIFVPIFTDGTWVALTTVGAENYHPLWAPLLIGETAFNVAMILASCYLIYLFFIKRRLFPRLYIIVILVTLVFIPLDAWVASFVLTDEPVFDPETTKEFARTLVAAIIWIPYMLISKRVKATFINLPSERTPAAS